MEEELAAVSFVPHEDEPTPTMGSADVVHHMYVAMPKVEEHNGKSTKQQWYSVHHQNKSSRKAVATMLQFLKRKGQLEAAGLAGLRQKPPVFNRETKQYRQNFRGRATLPKSTIFEKNRKTMRKNRSKKRL